MLKFKLKLIVGLISFLSISLASADDVDDLRLFDEKTLCGNQPVRHFPIAEVEECDFSDQSHDQGYGATCSTMVTYNLIQSLKNRSIYHEGKSAGKSFKDKGNPITFDLLDVLAKVHGNAYASGCDFVHKQLEALRNQRIAIGNHPLSDHERIYKAYTELMNKRDLRDRRAFTDIFIKQVLDDRKLNRLSNQKKNMKQRVLDAVDGLVLKHWNRPGPEMLFYLMSELTALLETRSETETLPPFQIDLYQTSRSKDLIEKVANLFSRPEGSKQPVALAYCTAWDKETNKCGWDRWHWATITGVRKIECGGKTHWGWKLRNSWGDVAFSDGWIEASDLAERSARLNEDRFAGHIVYITPHSDKTPSTMATKSKVPGNTLNNETQALTEAAIYGNTWRVKELLAAPIKPNKEEWAKAISIAADFSHTEVLRQLVENKSFKQNRIDINVRNQGKTPLHLVAGSFGNKPRAEIISLLIQHKADPELRDNDGFRPIDHAIARKFLDRIDALLFQGGKVTYASSQLNYFLHEASADGNLDLVKFLVERLAKRNLLDVESRSDSGHTALQIASENQRTNVVQYLLEAKANPNPNSKSANTIESSTDLASELERAQKLEKLLVPKIGQAVLANAGKTIMGSTMASTSTATLYRPYQYSTSLGSPRPVPVVTNRSSAARGKFTY